MAKGGLMEAYIGTFFLGLMVFLRSREMKYFRHGGIALMIGSAVLGAVHRFGFI